MTTSNDNILRSLKGKRVLVTGATGFIGSNLVRHLVNSGAQVTVLIRPAANLWRIHDLRSSITTCLGDLARLHVNECAAKLRASNIQIIFHLGASGVNPSKVSPESVMEANVTGTVRMLELARFLKVERFIHCGSCFEYKAGQALTETDLAVPSTPYGISKLSAWMIAEMFHKNYHIPVVCLRPFTVYGPFEGEHRLVPQVITRALQGGDIKLTSGKQTRDLVYVDDVVEAFLRAAVVHGIEGETFNIAGGEEISVKEVVQMVLDLTQSASKPLFGAIPDRENEIYQLSGNPEKAKAKLGWSPRISLEEGLGRTIEWFKENQERFSEYAHLEKK